MINHVTNHDISRWVIYKPAQGEPESGRIKSHNEKYIFVVYECKSSWSMCKLLTGRATNPEDLEWDLNKGKEEVCPHCHYQFSKAIRLSSFYWGCKKCKRKIFSPVTVSTRTKYLTVQQMFGKDSGGDAEPISHRLNK